MTIQLHLAACFPHAQGPGRGPALGYGPMNPVT